LISASDSLVSPSHKCHAYTGPTLKVINLTLLDRYKNNKTNTYMPCSTLRRPTRYSSHALSGWDPFGSHTRVGTL